MINYRIKTELTGERTKYTDAVFTTGDVRGYRLTFEFTENGKPIDISGCMLTVKAKRADGVIIIDSGTVEESAAYYDVKNSMISIAGELSFEIALSDSGGMYLTVSELIASVRYGYGEADLKGTDKTPVLSTLLTAAESAKESASAAETAAESAKELATEAYNTRNYDYTIENFDSVPQLVSVTPNTVTYLCGTLEGRDFDEMYFALVDADIPTKDLAEEYVLILDFTAMTSIPAMVFDGDIKWLGGNMPAIEAGKVYMFSFVKMKSAENKTLFQLGVGGEFL